MSAALLSRLGRLVPRVALDRCRRCGRRLRRCPTGRGCPGSDPLHPGACRSCSWGAVCSVHGRRWTSA